ncbi:MAG: carbonic anhydrase [Acidimicrobiales bacterium]
MTDPAVTIDEARTAARLALLALLEGNRRFAEGSMAPRTMGEAERAALLEGQEPIAVLLGCVDSRVPPEVVLDQGVGDLLTVRTAGQSLAGVALGSIEFGVRVLGIPLVVVMGHTGCGAVLAALTDDHADGHLGELTGEVADRLAQVVGEDPVRATGANLAATVDVLRSLGTLVTPAGHHAFVVGALYDMATGRLEVSDDAGLLEA